LKSGASENEWNLRINNGAAQIKSLCTSPDRKYIGKLTLKTAAVNSKRKKGVGYSNGNCCVVDVRTGCVVSSWRAHDSHVVKLELRSDGKLITGSTDRTVNVWRNTMDSPMNGTPTLEKSFRAFSGLLYTSTQRLA